MRDPRRPQNQVVPTYSHRRSSACLPDIGLREIETGVSIPPFKPPQQQGLRKPMDLQTTSTDQLTPVERQEESLRLHEEIIAELQVASQVHRTIKNSHHTKERQASAEIWHLSAKEKRQRARWPSRRQRSRPCLSKRCRCALRERSACFVCRPLRFLRGLRRRELSLNSISIESSVFRG